ncbi:NAD(P)-dependent oxidoreductase [Candidatus Clostridium radicumherbarum]|uniref:precorrin-2 dehydrogenase n=1 Tax=Candidatus Clostridium radicumherbarum TaxID=3381662 RepID=A0ABW8TU43_9CLOT
MIEDKITSEALEPEYTYMALLSNKINVLIVGGKRSAYIKCKTFSEKGCSVVVVAEEFGYEFEEFKNMKNVNLINGSYKKAYLEDKHLVVIALPKGIAEEEIKKDCEEYYKIYLTCSNYRQGNFITPYQRNSQKICFGLNIKNASPFTSRFIGNEILKGISKYDSYVSYVSSLREKLRNSNIKDNVLSFISSEDFYYFYELGKADIILKMFYE